MTVEASFLTKFPTDTDVYVKISVYIQMDSKMHICLLLVLAVSVYVSNSQPTGQPPSTGITPHAAGTGNTPQVGGTDQCQLDQYALQMCSNYCTRRGCQPRPCTPRTAIFGCRCHNCSVPNWPYRPNQANAGPHRPNQPNGPYIPNQANGPYRRNQANGPYRQYYWDSFDRSDMIPDWSDMVPDYYY